MFRELTEYAKRIGLVAEKGFAPKATRWLVVLDERSRFLDVVEQTTLGTKKGRVFPKAPHLMIGNQRGLRHFLIDTAQHALGYELDTADDSKVEKHKYFLDLISQAAAADPVFGTISAALSSRAVLDGACAKLKELGGKSTNNVTFAVRGPDGVRIPADETCWHEWWRETFPGLLKSDKCVDDMVCLVTGRLAKPARIHPKIKGISKSELSLVSCNWPAAESFGLKQARNVPVCEEAAEQYAAALNHLLEHNCIDLAGVKVVYWYDEDAPAEDDLIKVLLAGNELDDLYGEPEAPAARRREQAENAVRLLLTSVRQGGCPEFVNRRYYVMLLSGNLGRAAVRGWMGGQLSELADNISAWFDDLAITKRDGSGVALLHKFRSILAASVRKPVDDPTSLKIPAPATGSLWQAAIGGRPIPRDIVARTLACVRSHVVQGKQPSLASLGLLKAYCVRNGDTHMKPALNENHPDPAYHCGRLFATLAYIQYKALGPVNANVVQRFYGSASTAPAQVFGRLVQTAQFHLHKIENGGIRFGLEKRMGEILERIKDGMPNMLTLEQRTLFALGYYHQSAYRKPKAEGDDDSNVTVDTADSGHDAQ